MKAPKTKGPGGPSPLPEWFVNREYILGHLGDYLKKGMNCQIVGPRGIGKTALLTCAAALAAQELPRSKVALIDLTIPQCHTVRGLMEAVSVAWGIVPAVPSVAGLSRHVEQWRRERIRAVLCLDQFEEIAGRQNEFTLDFFLDLRQLAHEGVTLLTTGEKTLSQLLPGYLPTSPFFNVFGAFYLGPLSPDDAADLLTLRQRPDRPLAAEDKQAIIDFGKGYPLRLEVALKHVLDAKERGEALELALHKAEEALSSPQPPAAQAS